MIDKKQWFLQTPGLDVRDRSRVEWICICPFCGNEGNHFYLNSQKLVYDCKICGAKGNCITLMAQLAVDLAEEFDDEALAALAHDRHLSTEAFDGCGFG